jgi:RimJ/RimL family protein N-acetyltransferase
VILDKPLVRQDVTLRSLTAMDATDTYCDWMNDHLVTRYLESRFRKFAIADLEGFIETCNDNPDVLLLGITLNDDARHIGNIKLGPIDRHHRLGDIGLLLGDSSTWGKGYARQAIAAISDYALSSLGLHKITASCYGSNVGSQKAFAASGFVIEGVRARHFRSGDVWEHSIMMARFAEDAA